MRRILIISFTLIAAAAALAQPVEQKKAYRIVGSNIVLHLKKSWPRVEQERLLEQSGMSGLSLDTLWTYRSLGRFGSEGWKLSCSGNTCKIYKSITSLSSDVQWEKTGILPGEFFDKIVQQTAARFGINRFRKPSVFASADGNTQFFLEGNLNVKDVYLSGTFNEWSTLATRMMATDSGWLCNVRLKPGKHVYKFIVGGRWMTDPRNELREDDYYDGQNSIYFVTNYEFRLDGHKEAKRVFVAGSFNAWRSNDLSMQRDANGWKLSAYLQDGPYEYKFFVDSQWMLDPANSESRGDQRGNQNSILRIGKPYVYSLNGYTDATTVSLAGTFNNWNPTELRMVRVATGWKLPMVLAPGNYLYKFIVDGKWIRDPQNPHSRKLVEENNSVCAVKPNHSFTLPGNIEAREVMIAGTFNDWQGYTLEKKGDVWSIDLFIPPGKCLYKFVIDGKWIIDPNNSLWEQNQYGTGNSVLWIPPQ